MQFQIRDIKNPIRNTPVCGQCCSCGQYMWPPLWPWPARACNFIVIYIQFKSTSVRWTILRLFLMKKQVLWYPHPKWISFVKYLLWSALRDSLSPVCAKDVIIFASFNRWSCFPRRACRIFFHVWKKVPVSWWSYTCFTPFERNQKTPQI